VARALAALLLTGSACQGTPGGDYSLAFTWEGGKPATLEGLQVRVRIEARTEPTKPGRVLSDAGPAPFREDGTLSLVLPELTPGEGRVVVAEVRTGPLPTDPVAYYGRSEPFTVEPGVTRTVPIAVPLRPIPSGGGEPPLVVLVDGAPPAGDAALVRTAQVSLRLTTDTGVTARLSDDPTFPGERTTTVDLTDAEPMPGSGGTLRRLDVPWDLDAGRTPCAANYCPRRVYARFTDAEGYESLTAEARAVLDVVAPSLVQPGGVSITPALANARSEITVSLTFDEPLGAPPALALADAGAPPFPFEQLFPAPGDPLGTTYTLRATLEAGTLAAGEHALGVTAVDRAGNPASPQGAVNAGAFTVDPAPPTLTLGPVVTPSPDHPGYVNQADEAVAATSAQGEGSAITLTVSTSEPLVAPPAVRMGPLTLACAPEESGSGRAASYACAYALTGADPDGVYTVTASGEDLAGNAAAAAAPAPVVFDTEPPRPVQVLVDPPVLAPGRAAVVQVGMSEAVGEDLTLSVVAPPGSGADPASVTVEQVAQSSAGATWLVTALDTAWDDGPLQLQVQAADVAGNVVSPADSALGEIALDGTPPALTSLGLEGEPFSVQGATFWGFNAASLDDPQATITARFYSPEPLQEGAVRASLGAYSVACSREDSLPDSLPGGAPPGPDGEVWRCPFLPSGDEPDGVRIFVLEGRDLAGNPAELELTGEPVIFDRTPPEILGGTESLLLTPSDDNPLVAYGVSAAGSTTAVRLRFGVSEPLSAPPTVEAIPVTGDAAAIPIACDYAPAKQTVFVCEVPPGGLPSGLDARYGFQVSMADVLQNPATVTLGSGTGGGTELRVDTIPPPSPDVSTEGRVVLARAPWGTAATDFLPRLGLRGLAGALTPEADLLVRALAGEDPTQAAELGRAAVDDEGGFGRCPTGGCATDADADLGTFTLAAADLQAVWVQTIDGAGNTSPAVQVRDVTWFASLGGKVLGDTAVNPHRLEAFAWTPSTPLGAQGVEETLSEPATVRGRGRWTRLRSTPSFTPPARDHANVGFDPYRARLVLFSGDAALQDTWESNGQAWTPRCNPASEACVAPASDELSDTQMVYDPARGELLYVTPFSDALWGWDGTKWTQRCGGDTGCSMPVQFAFEKTLAYDEGRRRVVALFSDFTGDAVRAWTGVAWEPLCPQGDADCGLPAVPLNGFPKLAYDGTRQRLVLYFADHSVAQTWELASDEAEATWTLTCDGSVGTGSCPTPADGYGAGAPSSSMVFDERAGEVVLLTFPGMTTWTYAGAGWEERSQAPVSWALLGLRPHPYYDRGRGTVRAYLPDEATIWEWTGDQWRRTCGPGGACEAPGTRWGAAAASDGRRSLVLFGGREEGTSDESSAALNDTWRFDGRAWTFMAEASPSGYPAPTAGAGGVMTFLPSSREYLLLPPDESLANHPGKVAAWRSAALEDGSPTLWEDPCRPLSLDAILSALCSASGPRPRAFATLRWDPIRKAAVLLGGRLTNATSADSLGCLDVSCEAWAWRAGHWLPAGDTALPRAFGHASVSPDGWPGLWSYGGLDSRQAFATRSASLSQVTLADKGAANWSLPCGSECTPGARVGAHLTYDPDRHALLLFGGYDDDPNEVLADATVWEYRRGAGGADPGTWTTVPCPDDAACTAPTPRAYGTLEYLPSAHQHVLFGGTVKQGLWNSDVPDGDTWLYDAGASGRPGQVLTVAYVAAGGPLGEQCAYQPGACPLRRLRVRWAGEATSVSEGGTPVSGVRLRGWAHGRWEALGVAAGGSLDWTTQDTALMGSLLVPSRDGIFHLALEPLGTNGDLPEFAQLRTDELEVAVSYHLAPEGGSCGDGVLNAGEACDLGADANDGSYGGCTADCRLAPRCGDGILDEEDGEGCDDGGLTPGDGCNEACQAEDPPACEATPLPFEADAREPIVVVGDTTEAPLEHTGSCAAATPGGGDAWLTPGRVYEVVAPGDGTLTARLDGPGALDATLSARDGCGDASTEQACMASYAAPSGGAWITLPVTAGASVTLLVQGLLGATGPFELTVGFEPQPPADGCAGATPVMLGAGAPTVVTGTTTGEQNALGAPCTDTASPERVFSFVAPGDGEVHARALPTASSTLDPVVWFLRSSCKWGGGFSGFLPASACDDDAHGRGAEAKLPVQGGQSYFVVVGGYGQTQGDFDLALAFLPSGASPDPCDAPELVSLGAGETVQLQGSTKWAFDEAARTFRLDCGPLARWTKVYEVMPASNGVIHARVDGIGGFDPVLYGTSETCDESSDTECQDDASATDRGASVDIETWAGAPVYIQIQGYDGQVGDFSLELTQTPQ